MQTNTIASGIDTKSFDNIRNHVKNEYGINLTLAKKHLVENRLYKRLKHYNFNTFSEYHDFLFSGSGRHELALLSDYLSTNKTYFYREHAHFQFFQKYLASLEPNRSISLWSAAASTGDEAYTLSILLNEHNEAARGSNINYTILGTDISTSVIEKAKAAVYSDSNLGSLPTHLFKKYFVQVADEFGTSRFALRDVAKKNVWFKKFNLIKDIGRMAQNFDIIFCRNVLIYFNEETKSKVCRQLIDALKPGGYLVLGHCEGFVCKSSNLRQIQPAIFQKK